MNSDLIGLPAAVVLMTSDADAVIAGRVDQQFFSRPDDGVDVPVRLEFPILFMKATSVWRRVSGMRAVVAEHRLAQAGAARLAPFSPRGRPHLMASKRPLFGLREITLPPPRTKLERSPSECALPERSVLVARPSAARPVRWQGRSFIQWPSRARSRRCLHDMPSLARDQMHHRTSAFEIPSARSRIRQLRSVASGRRHPIEDPHSRANALLEQDRCWLPELDSGRDSASFLPA